jgi:hypothetical protein
MLAELAEVVVGVETRSQTHTAAVVDAGPWSLPRRRGLRHARHRPDTGVLGARRCGTGSSVPETADQPRFAPVALCRLQRDERTRTRIYTERRRAEGKTDREIKRCLKRYIARELNPRPESPPLAP